MAFALLPTPTRESSTRRPRRPAVAPSRLVGGGGALAWIVAVVAGEALSPPPLQAVMPTAVEELISLGLMFALLAAVGALLGRHRLAARISAGSAGLWVLASLACPASGHHAAAPWWFGQLALYIAVLVGSLVAARRA